MFGLKNSDIHLIIKTLQSHPKIEEAILFGSRAMGNFKPGSDIDLALKGTLDGNMIMEISVELNERLPLPFKFDVVAYASLEPGSLKDHIDQQGKSFYLAQRVL